MKISFRASNIAVLATACFALSGFAQTATPTAAPTNAAPLVGLAPGPVPAKTNAAAKPKVQIKGATKPVAKKAAAKSESKAEPVLHPEPGIAKQGNVNVRGQALINSEIVAHLQKNQPITILEAITIKKPKQDEPANWYRILLPTNSSVWVHSSFIDAASSTVKGSKLNLRAGPGEEYSILGRLEKGAAIKQLEAKAEWLKIEAPTNATGFVAAHLVTRTPGSTLIPGPEIVESKRPEVISVPPTTLNVATNPATAVAENPPVVPVIPPPPVIPTVTTPVDPLPDAPIEKVKKIVSREGLLKGSFSIQAPTYFELRSLDTGKTINYVFSPSASLLLKDYKGQRIIVTGEELLDERWQHTPVIIVDALQVVP